MRGQVLTLLLAVTLAAACSSAVEEPPPLPRIPSESATPTEEPAALPAAVPSAAQAETPEGAAAFARFFYAEVERAYEEKDPDIVRALSAPDCRACARFMQSVADLRDTGGRTTGVIYNIRSAEVPALTGEGARVTVIYNSPAIQGLDANGMVVHEEPAVVNFEEQVELLRATTGWLVAAVKVV